MDAPSVSWYRVLPKPPSLYNHEYPTQKARRDSSLLQHKIVHEPYSRHPLDGTRYRRNTLDSIPARPSRATSPDLIPLSQTTERLRIGALTRKRAASQMAVEESPRSASPASPSTNTAEPTTQFCLCQPDPKIPRPRNAFILYRQHYQGAVVSQHPGLANPEISKIIGEQWRALPERVKTEWKALAEEEKARHQQQYPEYRYQPRRYGRNSNGINGPAAAGSTISVGPSGNCLRCGGRIMNPPATPSTPYTPGHPPNHPLNPSASGPGPHFARARIGSPPGSAGARRFDYGGGQRLLSPGMEMRDRIRNVPTGPMSPDPKRRRFNGGGVYIPVDGNGRPIGPGSPAYPYTPRRESLPRPEAIHPRHPSYGVAPPQLQRSQFRVERDPSLTLPPLQTPTQRNNSDKSNVEAMVMTIAFINKIKVLAKVSPPLAAPGPLSPARHIRGAVIAVEGSESASVDTMLRYLEDMLQKETETYSVRVFQGPDMKSTPTTKARSEGIRDATVDYLDTIATWHKISDEIVDFITTPPTPSSSTSSHHSATPRPSISIPNTSDRMEIGEEPSSGVSPKSIIPRTEAMHLASPTTPRASSSTNSYSSNITSAPPDTTMSEPSTPSKPPIPIALIPRYQLSTVDAAACAIPISDAYSPTDHWQWAATLWRGCVGPDITVYVRDCEKEEVDKFGGGMPVEIRLQDAKTVVVRKVQATDARGGDIDEKALRRVGFEIDEYLRK